MSDSGSPKNAIDQLRIDRGSEENRRSSPWIWILLALLLIAAAVVGWLKIQNSAPEVTVATAQRSATSSPSGAPDGTVLDASGYVTPRRKATVSSKVTGKITEVLIEEGMNVKEGQVLAQLDTSNVDANLNLATAEAATAKAALQETEALLAQAEQDLVRIQRLAEAEIASASELDAAEAQAKSLRARLARQKQEQIVAQRAVDLWNREREDRTIKAPFAGVVVAKNAQPGEMISPVSAGGGFTRTGIGTIVDMESLEIEVDVNESYINRVHPDQTVNATLDSYPDWNIPAKVIAIIPTADRQKATVRVRIGFDQLDPRILPDMGVKVSFQSAAPDSTSPTSPAFTSIPAAAVQAEGSQSIVLVVKNGVVERRAVRTGRERNGTIAVLAGLEAGERVVTDGPNGLANGDRVKERKP